MSAKVRWIIAGTLVVVVAVLTLLRSGKGPGESLVRPPDIPRPDPSKYGPRALKFTPASVDCGEIGLGQRHQVTVQVENKSAAPVRVYRVLFPCPCLTGAMEEEVIPAGQSVNLIITFTGLPGKREYTTVASIVTDEMGPSKYDLPVTGKIRQDFILEPETLVFGKLKKGATKVLETTVRRRDGAPFEIRELRCARPDFALKASPVGGAYRIEVSLKAERSGNLTEEVTVLTNAPPEVSPVITLSADVESEFAAEPDIATAKIGADGKVEAFEVLVRHLAGGAAQIDSVREGRSLPVEFVVLEKGTDRSKLQILLTDGLPTGAPFGEFLITLSGHSDEPVHLPYRIDIPPSKSPENP